MARAIETIYSALEAGFITAAAAVGVTVVPQNWSDTDNKKWSLKTVSEAHGIQEQLFDAHTADVYEIQKSLPTMINAWYQYQMLNVFEYDAIAVPIIQFDSSNGSFRPYYPNPNPNFRIVKYCSVVPALYGITLVKMAAQSGGFPIALGSTKLSAAQSFLDQISIPGVNFVGQSFNSDKLFLQLDVTYNGLYAAVISTNVIAAINGYLASIPFNGKINLLNLEIAIKAVAGVIDVVLINVQVRPDTIAAGSGVNLVLNKLELLSEYSTYAGYIVPETTTAANWLLTDFRVGSSGLKNLNLISQ